MFCEEGVKVTPAATGVRVRYSLGGVFTEYTTVAVWPGLSAKLDGIPFQVPVER